MQLREISEQNRHKLIEDSESSERAVEALCKEFGQELMREAEGTWEHCHQIVFPYLYRTAETGVTLFPHSGGHSLRPDRAPSLAFTRSDLKASERGSWDYYRSLGLDNAIVKIGGVYRWFLTW